MRIISCVFALILCSLSSFAQYDLKFNIPGTENTETYLGYYYADKQYIRDTAKVDAKGNFRFKGDKKLEKGLYLIVLEDKKWFEIILDSNQTLHFETDTNDLIGNLKSYDYQNKIFYSYMRRMSAFNQEIQNIRSQFASDTEKLNKALTAKDSEMVSYRDNLVKQNPGSFFVKILSASREPEVPTAPILSNGRPDSIWQYQYYKNHFFEFVDLNDEGLLRTPVFYPKLERFLDKVISQNPDTVIMETDKLISKTEKNKEMFRYMVHTLAGKYENSKIMGHDKVFLNMIRKYYQSGRAYWMDTVGLVKILDRIRFLENCQIGMKAKDMVMEDTLGRYHRMYDIQAPFTILYFWTPECHHCQKETPEVYKIYEKFKAKGVKAYVVCTEREADNWKKYIKEHNLNWLNVYDPKPINNFKVDYDIMTTPQLYVVDENKVIVAKKIDATTLEKVLENEFAQLEKKGLRTTGEKSSNTQPSTSNPKKKSKK